jgi:hypothetical protein
MSRFFLTPQFCLYDNFPVPVHYISSERSMTFFEKATSFSWKRKFLRTRKVLEVSTKFFKKVQGSSGKCKFLRAARFYEKTREPDRRRRGSRRTPWRRAESKRGFCARPSPRRKTAQRRKRLPLLCRIQRQRREPTWRGGGLMRAEPPPRRRCMSSESSGGTADRWWIIG